MHSNFRGYYPPREHELAEVWSEGIIILDTNTLLNLFRYTPTTRDDFLAVLEKLKGSLWIPYHVGLEFHRLRLGVISNTSEAFAKVADSLEKAQSDIAATLNRYKHHPSLNRGEVLDEVNGFFETLTTKLDVQQQEHHRRIVTEGDAEQTFQRITNLFFGRVGAAFTPDELSSIYEEGAIRYEQRIPPGYKDKDDSSSNQYGDLIIWKEILKLGADKKKPAIFVTDDAKDDWWWIHRGETQGPRVELVNEYWLAAECRIHFYEPLRFLEYAKVQTNTEISRQSLDEVEEVSSANSRAYRVLQERKVSLEAQQDRLLRLLERTQSNEVNISDHQKLIEEHASLLREQRVLDHQLEAEHERASLLAQNDRVERAAQPHREPSKETVVQMRRIAELEGQLAFLRNRRAAVERQLQYREQPRMYRARQNQMVQIQEELEEIRLALAELSD